MGEINSKSAPTVRMLAAIAGLSATAVSMALRNSPRISEATRRRVKAIARKHGYKPDPEVTKLMLHLRKRRTVRTQAALCGVTNWPSGAPNAYYDPLLAAIKVRALEQGYSFDLIHLEEYHSRRNALQRILRARGVQGVVLLTLATPLPLGDLLDWSHFSVVATSYSVLTPSCHRVVPHHFENAMLALQNLHRLGYRRIGLVLSNATDLRTHHCNSAALTWHQRFRGGESVTPLLELGGSIEVLREWLQKEKPDAIVGEWAGDLLTAVKKAGGRVPGELAVVSLTSTFGKDVSRIDERPGDVGDSAVDLLASMVARGEKGLPATSRVTMLEGRWIAAATSPARGAVSSRR